VKRQVWWCAFVLALSVSSASAQTASLNLSRDLVRLGIAAQNLPPDDPTFDARPLFQAGVQYVRNNRIPLLTVDRGSYYFLTPQVSGAYLRLFQVSDLVVDLAGSTIYFRRAFLAGFLVANSQRVTLTNFQIDFVDPPYTHVELTSVDAIGQRLLYKTLPGWVDPSTFSLAEPLRPMAVPGYGSSSSAMPRLCPAPHGWRSEIRSAAAC
jgi:hypothetical protein